MMLRTIRGERLILPGFGTDRGPRDGQPPPPGTNSPKDTTRL